MTYLVDSNVVLEAALHRQHAEVASKFLTSIPATDLAMTLFSLHSLGFYLARKAPDLFDEIITDLVSQQVTILQFEPSELRRVTRTTRMHGLDFDDVFIYAAAERDNLKIVSFDADFDRTPRGRLTPAQVLASISPP